MRILVIDRDRLSSQLIKSKLEAAGHEVFEEAVKNDAIARLERDPAIDAVFFDPQPLTDARPVVLGIRKVIPSYNYISLISNEITSQQAIRMGCNDGIRKPLDTSQIEEKAKNAQRLVKMVNEIRDESEDFPSGGGVISKSAFNQLFLSAIDRADRYGELSYVVSIGIQNYEEIKNNDGPYAAEYAFSKLAQHLVRLRRQSDIVGQIGPSEYALLLQRPQNESEPIEAAKRFATSFNDLDDITSAGTTPLKMYIKLIDLPTGAMPVDHSLVKHGVGAQNAG